MKCPPRKQTPRHTKLWQKGFVLLQCYPPAQVCSSLLREQPESTSGQRNWELQTAELFTAPRSCQMKSIPGCAPKSIQKCTRQRNISGRIHSFFLRTIQALLSPQPPLTVQEQARISLISWTGTWKRHQFTPEAGALSSQPKCSGCVLEAVTKPSAFKSPCRAGVTPA